MRPLLSRLLLAVLFLALPLATDALTNVCLNAREQCTGWFPVGKPCICVVSSDPALMINGVCAARYDCQGQSYTGLNGQPTGVGDIGGIVGQIFKTLLDKLLQGGGDAGLPGGGTEGCTQYYTVTVPSSDPCARYVPPVTDTLLDTGDDSAIDDLLDSLDGDGTQTTGGGTDTEDDASPTVSVSDQILDFANNPEDTAADASGTGGSDTSLLVSGTIGSQAVNLQPGTQGNIEITSTGVTVVAQARDAETNSGTAGFYGSDTFGTAEPQGMAAKICQSRPWAGSVVSFVIPPSFFDSLCAWRGYQVGLPQPPATPTQTLFIEKQPTSKSVPAVSTPAPTIPPSVDIWATPATVALGSRTSIFWNAKGVVSCIETSPDGSFSQNTLSGGASTVPLSGATVFTISCLTEDGTPVTDYVTVNLAI